MSAEVDKTMKAGRPKTIDWSADFRTCPGCRQNGPQPLENFGRDSSRPNGRLSHCRPCWNQRQIEKRAQAVERKPSILSMSVKDRVIWAMKRGARTRESIQAVAGIRDEDRMSDALADLYDTNQLDRRSLKARVYRLCA
jgi:hypothetical protein